MSSIICSNWVDTYICKLFEAEDQKYVGQVNAMIEENNKFIKRQAIGFNYCGKNYGLDGRVTIRAPSLVSELMPAMAKIANFRKTVNFDRALITQVLHTLLEPCVETQHFRDALPECLVALDPTITGRCKRIQEAAWTIREEPRLLRQYQKILPKIEVYCAMRFLY